MIRYQNSTIVEKVNGALAGIWTRYPLHGLLPREVGRAYCTRHIAKVRQPPILFRHWGGQPPCDRTILPGHPNSLKKRDFYLNFSL